jgi:hypothetical protein
MNRIRLRLCAGAILSFAAASIAVSAAPRKPVPLQASDLPGTYYRLRLRLEPIAVSAASENQLAFRMLRNAPHTYLALTCGTHNIGVCIELSCTFTSAPVSRNGSARCCATGRSMPATRME